MYWGITFSQGILLGCYTGPFRLWIDFQNSRIWGLNKQTAGIIRADKVLCKIMVKTQFTGSFSLEALPTSSKHFNEFSKFTNISKTVCTDELKITSI